MLERIVAATLCLSLLSTNLTPFDIRNDYQSSAYLMDDADDEEMIGYFGDNKYQIFDEAMSWFDAKEQCAKLGGHLATITSQDEQDFLTELSYKSEKPNLWLGAMLNDSSFEWITGENWEFENWDIREPNNSTGDEDVLTMFTAVAENQGLNPGEWNDMCSTGADRLYYHLDDFGFICEWEDIDYSTDSPLDVEVQKMIDTIQCPDFSSWVVFMVDHSNFPCSYIVHKNAGNIFVGVKETLSNLLFRGYDGISEQFFNHEISKQYAIDLLANLLGSTSNTSSKTEELQTLLDGASKACSDLVGGYFIESGIDPSSSTALSIRNTTISRLNTKANSKKFLNALLEGDADEIANTVVIDPSLGISLDSVKSYANKSISTGKTFEWFEKGFSVYKGILEGIDIAQANIDTMVQIQSLNDYDEETINTLRYIADNAKYTPLRNGAKELLDATKSRLSKAMLLLQPSASGLGSVAFDEACDIVVSSIPFGKLYQAAFDLGSFAGNMFFHTSDNQETYDQMKVLAFLADCLKDRMQEKLSDFGSALLKQDNDLVRAAIRNYARSVERLKDIRLIGEEVYQQHLDSLVAFGIELKSTSESRTISKSVEECLKAFEQQITETKKFKRITSFSVGCPVDVKVIDGFNNTVAYIPDGAENAEWFEGGSYTSFFDDHMKDYEKIITVPVDEEYRLEILGKGKGCVDLSALMMTEEFGIDWSSSPNIAVEEGDVLTVNFGDDSGTYVADLSKDGIITCSFELVSRTGEYYPAEQIDIHPEHETVKVGETIRLSASVRPNNATHADVYWESDDDTIATVDSDGIVKAKRPGMVNIICKSLDGLEKRTLLKVVDSDKPDDTTDDTPTVPEEPKDDPNNNAGDIMDKNQGSANETSKSDERAKITTAAEYRLNLFIDGAVLSLIGLGALFLDRKTRKSK